MPEAIPGPLCVVLPTYNEAEGIESIVSAILGQIPSDGRILIVDDSSPDGTGQIADRLAARHDAVSVLHRARKEGLGPAYVAGFRRALDDGAAIVGQMDSDFSHDPEELPKLIAATATADMAIGSRYVSEGAIADWGPGRRSISRFGNVYARAILGAPLRDLTGGFRVIRREVIEAVRPETITARGYAFQIELAWRAMRAGFRLVEVPITFRDRRVGASKMSRAIIAEAVWRVPAMRMRGW
jgi:dolichol-phosphate mannosyltransferase